MEPYDRQRESKKSSCVCLAKSSPSILYLDLVSFFDWTIVSYHSEGNLIVIDVTMCQQQAYHSNHNHISDQVLLSFFPSSL